MRPADTRAAGFTLLEVLVAFVIAALAIGVMVDGVVGGLRSASAAAHTQTAVSLARSRLAAAQAVAALGAPPPEQSGVDGAYRWTVRITPAGSASLPRVDPVSEGVSTRTPLATLYAIVVTISWTLDGGQRQVRLDGARLGMTPASPGA